jgi:hypothetical protein
MLKPSLVSLALLLSFTRAYAQQSEAALLIPSAEAIVQKSILEAGGDKFDEVKSLALQFKASAQDQEAGGVMVWKIPGVAYLKSSLGPGLPTSTISFVEGKGYERTSTGLAEITDRYKLERLKAESYLLPQLAYRDLGSKVGRLEDQKFANFDCYVVVARSPLEQISLNYFDKKSERLIMHFPDTTMHKQLFIESSADNSAHIKLNSTVLDVDGDKQTLLQLSAHAINLPLDRGLFRLDYSAKDLAAWKTGKFQNVDSKGIISRDESSQTEKTGESEIVSTLEWLSADTYRLTPKTGWTNGAPVGIDCRIVSISQKRALIQYTTTNGKATGYVIHERVD